MGTAEDHEKAVDALMEDPAFVEEIKASLEQGKRDSDYFYSIYDRMLEEHPDEFVAVYHGKVVAAHKTLEGAFAEIRRQGIPPGRVVLEFVETNPLPRIL